MNPYKDNSEEESSFTFSSTSPHLAYEAIATQLLKDNFFLTALELHTELVENGKELPQLREFFSNPGNFEQHVTRATDFNSIRKYYFYFVYELTFENDIAILKLFTFTKNISLNDFVDYDSDYDFVNFITSLQEYFD